MKSQPHLFIYYLIFCSLGFVTWVHSVLTLEENSPAFVDKLFLEELEKYVIKIPLMEFDGDTMLIQFTNRLNGKTDYRHIDSDLINHIVYERKSLDNDKEVVILSESEDHIITIPKGNKKRIYVVLRKNSLVSDAKVYFVSYLYIKDVLLNETKGIHQFGDRRIILEWDFWNHREDSKDTKAKELEEAFYCSSTIFIPCRSNETIDYPVPHQKSRSNKPAVAITTPFAETSMKATISKLFVTEAGYDADEYSEFFKDFEEDISQGNYKPPSGTIFGIGGGGIFQGLLSSPYQIFIDTVHKVMQVGMGLTKSFDGIFGGIGTQEAKIDTVVEMLLEEEGAAADFLNRLSSNEITELEDEIQLPSAGGLGGMLNVDEDKDYELEQTALGGMAAGNRLTERKSEVTDTTVETKREEPFVRFGWNTDLEPGAKNATFVGFGACRYRPVFIQDFENTSDVQEIVRLYQTVLRTQCITKDTKLYETIVADRLLILEKDHTLLLNKDSPKLLQEKLTQESRIKLYRALQLFMFSKVYMDELKTPTKHTIAPDQSPISRNTFVFGKAIQRGLDAYTWIPRKHCIKIARNLVKTLQNAINKLVEDSQVLSSEEREINFNDRVYLMGHIQYIIHGFGPVYREGADVSKTFQSFYNANKEMFEDSINNY